MRKIMHTAHFTTALFIFGVATGALADIYKCTVSGKITYQSVPCSGGEEKALDDKQRRMFQREQAARLQRETEATETRSRESYSMSGTQSTSGETSIRKVNVEQAMRAYFDKVLIDPSSVQFRNLQVFLDVPGSKLRTRGSRTTPLVDVVCGEVNSKNRLGGYVGYKYFYWDSDEKQAFGTLDDRDIGPIMQDVARKTCAGLR